MSDHHVLSADDFCALSEPQKAGLCLIDTSDRLPSGSVIRALSLRGLIVKNPRGFGYILPPLVREKFYDYVEKYKP